MRADEEEGEVERSGVRWGGVGWSRGRLHTALVTTPSLFKGW